MSKLLMLSGLPASGKSTRAKEIVAQGNWVRVNRDLLRTMLHFDNFTGRNEGVTVELEKTIAKQALNSGLSVVVDDCNLNRKNRDMWSEVAKKCGVKFETENVDTPWLECVMRDTNREKKVGQMVIKNMALQNGLMKPEKGWVICDLDGTLCNIDHRLHHVQKDPKDWKSFFTEIYKDDVREDVLEILTNYYKEGYQIIFVSARPEDYRDSTWSWLHFKIELPWTTLIMRRSGDKRPDTEVKQNILDTYFPDRKSIYKVVDDRPSVIRMWKENGLDVIDVGKGIEF